MSVTFELPVELERTLRSAIDDLDHTAKEGALVELYRSHRITQRQFSEALGISRLEAEAVLKRHNVTEDLLSDDEQAIALNRLNIISNK